MMGTDDGKGEHYRIVQSEREELVFKGPVHWTVNLTWTGLDWTEKDQTLGSVQSSLTPVQSMVQ